MSRKWKVGEIKVGAIMETVFWTNPIEDSKFPYRGTHLDGMRAPKVILCEDRRIKPGLPCLVKIKAITRADLDHKGAIEVDFERHLDFKLEGIYMDPMISKKLQILLESGLNILLDGPQGCGKTVTAKAIAKTLGMKFIYFNCGAVLEATDFMATIQVRASSSGQPITDFVKTEFLMALEEASQKPFMRYLIFLDELNRCPESARNALMPALDALRRIYHPIENSFLEITDNVQFIAAINRGREFSGTFGIDAAQLDRFAPLQMEYPPIEEEIQILMNRHKGLSKNLISLVVGIADEIRNSRDLTTGLSVRATDEACIYLEHPLMIDHPYVYLSEVLKSSFCGRFPGKWNDPSTDSGIVWIVIEKELKEKKK